MIDDQTIARLLTELDEPRSPAEHDRALRRLAGEAGIVGTGPRRPPVLRIITSGPVDSPTVAAIQDGLARLGLGPAVVQHLEPTPGGPADG